MRQEILRRLTEAGKAPPRWFDPESGRKGDISIDSLTLTDEQVDVLLQDDVDIALSIQGNSTMAPATPRPNGASPSNAAAPIEVEAEVETHLDLVGKVVNRSGEFDEFSWAQIASCSLIAPHRTTSALALSPGAFALGGA